MLQVPFTLSEVLLVQALAPVLNAKLPLMVMLERFSGVVPVFFRVTDLAVLSQCPTFDWRR